MAIAVQKYIKNMAKSVTYTATDVLTQKFEYVNDFKNENQEVFKGVYSSIKDYRTTFTRVKKTITNNKVMDAARVGYDSILYSITTGDFYAKQKETEVIEKYGGTLMQDFDMDDDDFDFENKDVSDGDKVIATAIKKNSKIGTALTVEAIAQTGKAQMDVAKENTMLLYTQNERMLNKLDNGFTNIMGFLKQNGEQNAKVQNQMNENLNKFMTNVDNNITKLTKQMDELLEMQRNMYNPTKKDEKKRVGYDDIISRNGVLNIKEYAKQIKKQGFNAINDMFGGALSQVLGDSMGEGTNMLAQFASSPFRIAMEAMANKALGKKFDNAAKELNTTLEGIIPSIIGRLNSASKREDSGIMGFLGKIFGIKEGSKESINTSNYNKGAIPFDGITKRAITDVIPYYLRKMTSILTGEQEMVYDFQTGKWTSMKAVKNTHYNTVNSANISAAGTLTSIIETGMGRRLNEAYQNKTDYERMNKAIKSLATKIQQSEGDFGSIKNSDLDMYEREVMQMLKYTMRLTDVSGKDRRFITVNGKKIDSGRGRSPLTQLTNIFRQQRVSQDSAIKNINSGDSILRVIEAEGLGGRDVKTYQGKGYVNNHGDFNQRYIQDMPMSQSLLRARDEYGITLYQYLRDMDISLRYIKANSTNLNGIGGKKDKKGKKDDKNKEKIIKQILGDGFINLDNKEDSKYIEKFYQEKEKEQEKKDKKSFDDRIEAAKKKAKEKGKAYVLATHTDFKSNDTDTGISRLMSDNEMDVEAKAILDYQKEQERKENERWKRMTDIFGKEQAQKMKDTVGKFDSTKSLRENMDKVKDQGFTNNLVMFTKIMSDKIHNPVNAATDAITKMDFYLQKLIYGEDLKESEKKKSLFTRINESFQKAMNKIRDTVDKGFEWLKKKAEPLLTPFKKIGEKLFGTRNPETGIYEEGLLSPFIGGVQKGLRKNAKDVFDYNKRLAKDAAKGIKDKLGIDDDDDSSSSPTPPTPEEIRRQSLNQKMTKEQTASLKNTILNRRNSQSYGKRNTNIMFQDMLEEEIKKAREAGVNNLGDVSRQFIDGSDINSNKEYTPEREKLKRLNSTIKFNKSLIKELYKEKDNLKEELKEVNLLISTYTQYKNAQVPEDLLQKKTTIENRIAEIERTIPMLNLENKRIHSGINKHIGKYKYMAAGGVNKTGKPFQSVLSAGEFHNGNIVPKMGVYTINPGDTVVNPAPASVRSKQASNERKYLANIRRNAEANDKLSPTPESTEKTDEVDTKEVEKLITETDWNSLTTKDQKAEFVGSVVSRGLIGGGLGLLVGGPLVGAAIGAASSLTKSTNTFSNFLFGEAIMDKDGNVEVDEKGRVKRTDNGLISKELMDAVPDIKKFGLGGLVAGLLTPIGPLGGVLAGSALGFAKNSEIFQGTLFGDGGILSDENKAKLKKGAKNMGIGAIIGAFTGPFGLVGNALLGATAGYVTSTDKFKDFVLGEKDNPDDPESKRHGGVIGALKKSIDPLKQLGTTLTNSILDAIFGKKGSDDKREGGLFGLVRKSIIEPLAEGSKSIIKELKNKATDIGFMAKKTWKGIQKWMSGGDSFGLFGQYGSKVIKGATKLASGTAKVALSPAIGIAQGVKGIGNSFKKKRIKHGRADDMTARERLSARTKMKMGDDEFSQFDLALTGMSNEDMTALMDRLSYTVSGQDALHNEELDINNDTTRELLKYLSSSERAKVIKMLKKNDYKRAETYIRTAKFKGKDGTGISQEERNELLKIANKHKKDRASLKDRFKKAKDAGNLTNAYLKETYGLDIDVGNEQDVDNIKRMLKREIAHNDAGLTEEDLEFDRLRRFWSDEKNSPLTRVNNASEQILKTIDNIYNEIKLSAEYDKLSDEEKAKYSSKEDYINSKKIANPTHTEDKLNGGSQNDKQSTNNNKSSSVANVLNRVAMVREKPNEFSFTIKRIIEEALAAFDSIVMKELVDADKLKLDIDKWKTRHPDEDIKTMVLHRYMAIEKFGNKYEFLVDYTCSNNKVDFCKKQPESFETARESFANEYLDKYMPKDLKNKNRMSFSDMVKKTIKMSGFFVLASVIPGGIFGLLGLNLGRIAVSKLKKPVQKGLRYAKFGIKHTLGSHEINQDSTRQKIRKKRWNNKANKLLEKDLADGAPKLNAISLEMYNKEYRELNESEQEIVAESFMNKYKDRKAHRQVLGHGLLGNVKKIGSNIKETVGEKKSGIQMKIAGSIDTKRKKIAEEGKQDSFVGKFFTKLDKWRLKRDEEKISGKKDSTLAKIFKWVFLGGIATPIIVGFVKKKLLPAIHEKVQPWLKKASEKVLGKKNEQTGEYEGGVISGIVNPIRHFFSDKFQIVHDWFHNEGKFTSPDTGFKGLINNFINVFKYGVELWKTGASTIINDVLPGVVEALVSKLPSILVSVGKGIVNGIASWFGKDDGQGKQALDKVDASMMISSNGSKDQKSKGTSGDIKFNNTVGGTFSMGPLPYSAVSPNYNNIGVKDIFAPTTVKKNEDGTTTQTNDNTGASVTSEFINDDEMVSVGKNQAGSEIFYKRSDKNHVQPYSKGANGEYVRMDKQAGVVLEGLQGNTSFNEMVERNNAGDAGVTNSYTGTTPGLDNALKAGHILAQATTSKANTKGLAMAIKAGGKAVKVGSKIISVPLKFIPGVGGVSGYAVNAFGKGVDKVAGKVASPISDGIYNLGQKKINKILQSDTIAGKGLNKVNNLGLKIQSKASGAKTKVKNAIKNTKVGSTTDDAVKSVKGLFKKAKNSIVDFFKNLFSHNTFKKALKEGGQEMTEEAIEKMAKESGEKLAKECAEAGAEKIAKAVGKSAVNSACASTGIGLVVTIALAIADFATGMADCRNILQVVDKDIPFGWRLFAGLANCLQDIPYVGILFGIIGAKNLVHFLVRILGPIIAPELTKNLRKKQDEAKATVDEYNRENNTKLTLEEYNNKFNANWWTKTKGAVADAGSFISGRDATVSQAMETRRMIEDGSKNVTKIREKLEDIASHMWEKEGKKFKKFNLDKTTYGKLCAEVIDKIVILLNNLDDNKLEKVLESAGKMRLNFAENAGKTLLKGITFGAVDADPFVDAWDDGYTGLEYLGLDKDKFENTDVVKCIGGIASVFVKSCGGAGLKPKIIDIVITVFGNGMAGDKIEENTKKIIDASDDDIASINSTYNKSLPGQASSFESNTTANDVIATNANANNKLTPIKNNSILSKIGSAFTSIKDKTSNVKDVIAGSINKAISAITGGGFAGIGEVINSLKRKNVAINQKIDALQLLPTDEEYWRIEVDDKHPFASAIFKFTESIGRVVKAPFSLAASMNASTANVIATSADKSANASSSGSNPTSNNGGNNSSSGNNNSKSSSGGIWSGIKKGAKKLFGGIKSLFGFGKGKGDSDASDPYHIYQRDFNQSYNISGDSEHQSVADSGCGPASAASILRMYGQEGNMNNAVNYALKNKYKEKDGGTYPSYFQDYLGKHGIATNSNASNADVINSLAQNKPVILMGQNKTGSKSTPYGNKYSHYVVARGFDKNGNVIIEDSEDRRGNTRYSLADTLKNTSVRITTGRGYGRGSEDISVNERYITNVNKTIMATVSSVIASAMSAANINGSSSNQSNTSNQSSGSVKSTTNIDIDSEDCIVCGDSITYGLHIASPLGERALGLGSGTTDKDHDTDAGSYKTIFKDHSDVISKAKNAIFFWGMNEVKCGLKPESYFARYQDSIDTILGYGGKSTANVNVCIMPVIAVPSGAVYTSEEVENFNKNYIKAFADKKGYAFIDIYEDSKDVPHTGSDVHPSNYNKLYEIIKKHTGGSSGSGRGKSIIEKNKRKYAKSIKSGRGIWGRDGEEETTSNTDSTSSTSSNTDSTSSTSSTTTTKSSGLISLLSDYSQRLTRGIFGNFYDALYGSEPEESNTNNSGSVGSGDAAKMLGKKLTLDRNNGRGTITMTIGITEDEVELYDMLTNECGLNAAVACGVISNWETENGINSIRKTAIRGPITYGGGIMQWTPPSIHTDWANQNGFGNDPWCWEANKEHAKAELIAGNGKWSRCTGANPSLSSKGFTTCTNFEDFKNLTSPEDAGVNYERAFEGSYNWDGRTSENVPPLPDNKYYDNNRALGARILYELIVNGKCDENGSGRGKEIIEKAIKSKNVKYGRSVWGRADDENTNSTTTTTSSQDETTDNTQETSDNSTTTDTSSSEKVNAKTLISKLSTYAKTGIKKIYGNFYNALYGNEEANTDNSIVGSDSVTQGTGVPYETYKHWKQGDYGTYPAPWANKSIATGGNATCANAGCGVVSAAILLVHSGSVMESDFDPGKFIDDIVSRGATDSSGCWKNLSTLVNYKNSNVMTNVEYERNCFGADYSGTSSWDTIYNKLLEVLNNGYYVMIKVTINGNGTHYVALDYIDTSNKEIYIMDPGSTYKEKLSDYGAGKVLGYASFKSTASNAKQYILNGPRTGSGRGKSNYKQNTYSFKHPTKTNTKHSLRRNISSNPNFDIEIPSGAGRGLSGLVSYDNINKSSSYNNKSISSNNNYSTNNTRSISPSYSSGTISNNTIDLNQLIGLISVIANNADKMDAVLQLLGAIASNTENTTSAITNKNNNKDTKNGLSALRNALNSSNSGTDIAKAVYEIARR